MGIIKSNFHDRDRSAALIMARALRSHEFFIRCARSDDLRINISTHISFSFINTVRIRKRSFSEARDSSKLPRFSNANPEYIFHVYTFYTRVYFSSKKSKCAFHVLPEHLEAF